MNLYKISQTENNDYDTYSDAIVCANNKDEARMIHPSGNQPSKLKMDGSEDDYNAWDYTYRSWCSSPELVTVELIGVAIEGIKKGIVLASFHAG